MAVASTWGAMSAIAVKAVRARCWAIVRTARSWSDFDTGLAIGGATLPAETYFVYGTPGTDGQDKLLDGWKDRALV